MLTLTEAAEKKIKQLTDERSLALRIDVVRGPHGCIHGWNFGLDDESHGGVVVHESEGITIFSESETAELIDDASVDYREDSTAVGFTIDAPSATHGGHGGCGHH